MILLTDFVYFQACQLAVKFLQPEKASQVIQHVGPMLIGIDKHSNVSIIAIDYRP